MCIFALVLRPSESRHFALKTATLFRSTVHKIQVHPQWKGLSGRWDHESSAFRFFQHVWHFQAIKKPQTPADAHTTSALPMKKLFHYQLWHFLRASFVFTEFNLLTMIWLSSSSGLVLHPGIMKRITQHADVKPGNEIWWITVHYVFLPVLLQLLDDIVSSLDGDRYSAILCLTLKWWT